MSVDGAVYGHPWCIVLFTVITRHRKASGYQKLTVLHFVPTKVGIICLGAGEN